METIIGIGLLLWFLNRKKVGVTPPATTTLTPDAHSNTHVQFYVIAMLSAPNYGITYRVVTDTGADVTDTAYLSDGYQEVALGTDTLYIDTTSSGITFQVKDAQDYNLFQTAYLVVQPIL